MPEKDPVKKTIRSVLWLAVGAVLIILVLALGQLWLMNWAQKRDAQQGFITQNQTGGAVEGVAGMEIGGPFELTRHDGQTVTYASLLGTPHIVFFGFTYCPDICPMELGTISNILDEIREERGEDSIKDLRVLFISVDPERDTPQQLANYVVMFHEKIEGLTGTPEQIDEIKRLYRVYAQRVQTEEMSDYTVDHSSFVYLFDRDAKLHSMFRSGTPREDLKKGVLTLIRN